MPSLSGSLLKESPRLMGVINLTTDSFSDGGSHTELDIAVAAAQRMMEEGADIIDVGGESTRPGASAVDVQEEIKRIKPVIKELSKNNNGSSFKWAKSLEERNKLWKARWDVYYSVKALIDNGRVYSTDVCLPISKITECVKFAEEEVKKFGLRAPMVGHLGDGNFHVLLPYNPKKKETYENIRKFSDLLIEKTLELEGTITGEHGVGLHKKEYLKKEHADNLPTMKLIKRTMDPNNIMNPGKIFDLN